jgi:hypothetical protein
MGVMPACDGLRRPVDLLSNPPRIDVLRHLALPVR